VSLKYLLDASTVSEPLRSRPSATVLRQLARHEDEVAIPSIVWHELRYGCARLAPSRRREAIETYLEQVVLASFPLLAYEHRAAEWHAGERARLEALGRTPPFVDGQIAAIAHVNDLTLVAADKTGFRGFKGLRVVSWT